MYIAVLQALLLYEVEIIHMNLFTGTIKHTLLYLEPSISMTWKVYACLCLLELFFSDLWNTYKQKTGWK